MYQAQKRSSEVKKTNAPQ